MSLDSQLHKVSPMLRKLYYAHKQEIDGNRRVGHQMREQARQYPHRNGAFFTRPVHPVEMQIIKELVPAIRVAKGKELQRAWYWVLNQDWGKDFRSCPFDSRYKHVKQANA